MLHLMVVMSLPRPDLLRSDGIPSSADPLPSPSPLSGSPKVSTPPGKARYRSKTRHRRANSKGSHNDFPGVLKSSSVVLGSGGSMGGDVASSEEQQPLYHHHHHLQHHHLHHHTLPAEGTLLPLQGRENVVANCANNLRYFGPAAALRSPQTDHFQRRVSGSSPDLISTAVDADSRRAVTGLGLDAPDATATAEDASASPIPTSAAAAVGLAVSTSSLSSGPGPLCPCCQAHPYPDCPHCQEETSVPTSHPKLPHYSLLSTREASPQPASPRLGQPISDSEGQGQGQGLGQGRGRGRGREGERERAEQGSPRSSLPPGVVRMLRPLRKVSEGFGVTSIYYITLLFTNRNAVHD